MRVEPGGLWLDASEVDAQAQRLVRLAQVSHSTQLAELATFWLGLAAAIASEVTSALSAGPAECMMNAWEYSIMVDRPLRTVQWQCAHGYLPSIKDDLGRWLIKVETSTQGSCMASL
jgi:hypothetical protein